MHTGTAPGEVVPKAIAAARKAVELDEKLAEAHTALGNALSANVQLSAAEQEFRRALELNPNYATAHQWLSECLFAQERFQESLAEIERAYELTRSRSSSMPPMLRVSVAWDVLRMRSRGRARRWNSIRIWSRVMKFSAKPTKP